MLSYRISNSVLTIGNRSDKPDGGISQVLYSYRKNVFPIFHNVVNYKRGGYLYKVWITIYSFMQALIILTINKNIRIVHIHTASDNGFRRNALFVMLSHFMRRKVVLHIHSGRFNDYYLQNKKSVERVLRKCDVIVALTEGFKDFYNKMGCDNVVVINNIVEPPQEKAIHKLDNKIHLLYLGVITKTKGIYDLLDVIKEHQKEWEDSICLHVGGNKEVDVLIKLIKDSQLENIVKFEGWVCDEKKVDLLNMCDIFILPSYTEGLPISILEAQSYGMYTIATNVGGIPEIVDSKKGKLFEPGNKEQLYKSIDDQTYSKYYLKNKDYIKEQSVRYLPDSVSKQLEKLYGSLLG